MQSPNSISQGPQEAAAGTTQPSCADAAVQALGHRSGRHSQQTVSSHAAVSPEQINQRGDRATTGRTSFHLPPTQTDSTWSQMRLCTTL